MLLKNLSGFKYFKVNINILKREKIMNLKRFILLVMLIAPVTNYMKAQDMNSVATCAGVVVGNASVDYVLGKKQAFNEALNIAYYAYLPSTTGTSAMLNYTNEEREFTEKIVSTNIDKVIMEYNNGNYDSNLYEEVVGCYRMLGTVLLKPEVQADLKISKGLYDEIIAEVSSNIRSIFDGI